MALFAGDILDRAPDQPVVATTLTPLPTFFLLEGEALQEVPQGWRYHGSLVLQCHKIVSKAVCLHHCEVADVAGGKCSVAESQTFQTSWPIPTSHHVR